MSKLNIGLLSFMVALSSFTPNFVFADNDSGDKFEKQKEKVAQKIERQIEKQEKQAKKLKEKEEKQKEKFDKKIEQYEDKYRRVCLQRFFPFSFGWINTNWDNINLDQNCPFPIPKPATSTPDTTAPIISGLLTKTGQTVALIVWNTDEKSTGKVYYSTTSPANTSHPSVRSFNHFDGKNHYAFIFGLSPNTNYYALVEAKDRFGNTSSNQVSFTTKSSATSTPPVPEPDTVAPSISNLSLSASTSSIMVSWNTNEAASSKVYFSTSTPINTALAEFVQSGALVTSHSLTINNLSTSTLFHLLIESSDASGNKATTSPITATTTSP